MEGAGTERRTMRTVCVTGAGGFVASWLVRRLLSTGDYTVHGTVRDPVNSSIENPPRASSSSSFFFPRLNRCRRATNAGDAKNAHLAALDGAGERLRLFRADLLDAGSLAAAVVGCDGVFHVASPVVATGATNPEVELIAPAVTGTMNVLKACSEAKVKRVVVVSSISAVIAKPDWPQGKAMDEDCWSDVEHWRATEYWYGLSKTLAELEALEYAKKSGLDVVTVCPSLVIGPLLQSTVNASSSFIVDYLKGDREVKSKLCSFVDVRDVADALLLVYETPGASGRYICNSHQRRVSDVIDLLKSWYPTYRYANKFVQVSDNPMLSSKKLETLGWKVRPLEESLRDSVESYRAKGVLD